LYSRPNKAFRPGRSSLSSCAREIAIIYSP